MPISGPASYLPTIELFLSHWDEVNTALGAGGPLMLPGGEERSNLADSRDVLEDARDAVSDNAVDRSLARAELDARIASLQSRMVEFNARMGAYRDAFTSRGQGSAALRVAQNLLAFSGGPIRSNDPAVKRGEALVADYLATANAALRENFGEAHLPEDVAPSKVGR